MIHPSLSGELIFPTPLNPQEVMDPYKPCWCQSGIKWKWCHKGRASQTPVNIWEHVERLRAEDAKGYCSHPNANKENCGEKIIQAHTVQKRGGLSSIAENGHVISAKIGFEEIFRNNGRIIPREIGIKKASTFMGFCGNHDTTMFKPIESGTTLLTKETAFLLSFRAIAYEVFTKQSELRSISIKREMDKGKEFYIQARIQEFLYYHNFGVERGLRDIKTWKANYDSAYLERNYDDFSYYAVEFSERLPIVACGAFYPEYDFNGKSLQRIARSRELLELVTLNLTLLNDRSVLVLGWSRNLPGAAADFVNSFINLASVDKANATAHLAFEHLENIYFRPSWWNSLDSEVQKITVNRFLSGTSESRRFEDCLSDRSVNYISSDIIEEYKSE